jgi:peptidoglycan/LPS O-acetylase OafA/YrhL
MSAKLVHLEAARGIASIIVVFHHFELAFCPAIKAPFWYGGLKFTPLYIFQNGEAAVGFFFLLSGYVLTFRFYRNDLGLGDLKTSVLKRLPRLMLPASITILAGYLILTNVPPYWQEANILVGVGGDTPWLESFANGLPKYMITNPTLLDALKQMLLMFLLPHNYAFNSNLWTMFYEFYGSLLVFGLVGCYLLKVKIGWLHLALLGCSLFNRDFAPFIIGSWIAYAGDSLKVLPRWPLVAMSVVLFSMGSWIGNLIGSISIMIAMLNSQNVGALSGRIGLMLGAISFPLYLVHALVILSFSSWVFVATDGSLLITLTATLVASALASVPLIVIDREWVRFLNSFTRKSLILAS